MSKERNVSRTTPPKPEGSAPRKNRKDVGDGAFGSLKYVMLADAALRESDIAPLVSDVLDAETIDNDFGRILFRRVRTCNLTGAPM